MRKILILYRAYFSAGFSRHGRSLVLRFLVEADLILRIPQRSWQRRFLALVWRFLGC
jgi:hypothetical protein